MALPIQPAPPTTMADSGMTSSTLTAAALRPSSTLRQAMKRMISPWFMNRKPMDPAMPSCQKIPAKLKSGGLLKSGSGSFHSVGSRPQKVSNPPR